MVGAKCKVSCDVPHSLASVLGFKRDIVYGVGRHASGRLVNIMNVNSILVHCNIINSSYMRGQQAPVVNNFFPNAAPGQKILGAPHNLIYLPMTVDAISTLSVWLTDHDGEHLDLRGEKVNVQYKVNVSGNQVDTLKNAIRLKKDVTLCFPKGGIRGDHALLLTPAQINRLDKARVKNSFEC